MISETWKMCCTWSTMWHSLRLVHINTQPSHYTLLHTLLTHPYTHSSRSYTHPLSTRQRKSRRVRARREKVTKRPPTRSPLTWSERGKRRRGRNKPRELEMMTLEAIRYVIVFALLWTLLTLTHSPTHPLPLSYTSWLTGCAAREQSCTNWWLSCTPLRYKDTHTPTHIYKHTSSLEVIQDVLFLCTHTSVTTTAHSFSQMVYLKILFWKTYLLLQ